MPHIKLNHRSSQPTLFNPALMEGSNTGHHLDMNIFNLEARKTGNSKIMGATKPTHLIAPGAHMMQVLPGTIGVVLHGSVLVMAFK